MADETKYDSRGSTMVDEAGWKTMVKQDSSRGTIIDEEP